MKYRRIRMLLMSSSLLLVFIFTGCTPTERQVTQTPSSGNSMTQTVVSIEPVHSITDTSVSLTTPSIRLISEDFMLAHTQEKPIMELAEIQRILVFLQQREEAWFGKPGWFLYRELSSDSGDYSDELRLIHLIDANGNCSETMTYFLQNGIPAPYSIRLADGTFAVMVPGKPPDKKYIRDVTEREVCTLKDGISVGFVHGAVGNAVPVLFDMTADLQQRLSDQFLHGDGEVIVSAWFEKMEGQFIFVINYDQQVLSSYMDEAASYLAPINRRVERQYINPDKGLLMKQTAKYYLEEELVGEWEVNSIYQFFEILPNEIERIYLNTSAVVLKESE